jgi:predicted transposase YbfD/YdcC
LKANQARLLEAAEWVFDPQLPADPSQTRARWSEVRRGKVWSYQVRASQALPEWVGFPGLKQLVVVEREVYDKRTRNLKQSRSYALTSLDWEAARLARLIRSRWGIENHDFLVRDVTFAEDRCLVRGRAAMGLAHLRGFAINCLRQWQVSNLTAAIERFAAKPFELLARLSVV